MASKATQFGFADGFVSVLLALYLTHLGFSPVEVGAIITGTLLNFVAIGFALSGVTVTNFWFALVTLGIGWNFMYVGGSTLLTSTYRPAERAKVQAGIEAFYDGFVEKAAKSRHMAPEKLEALARGRVWTGRQAKEIGLVDALGGLDAALAVAKHLEGHDAVNWVNYPGLDSNPYKEVADRVLTGADLQRLDHWLEALETQHGHPRGTIKVIALITETAESAPDCSAIWRPSGRSAWPARSRSRPSR